MLVIMDIEWNYYKEPTQLAAIRVNEKWQITDEFFSFIHCRNKKRKDIAYSGGKQKDFTNAPSVRKVMLRFYDWIEKNDILCWWHSDSEKVFSCHYKTHTPQNPLPQTCLLKPIASDFFQSNKNPYAIAMENGIEVPAEPHFSPNDVIAIRNIFAESSFPQKNIYATVKKSIQQQLKNKRTNSLYI